jgi:membrane-bound lytic murein transglycosylase A
MRQNPSYVFFKLTAMTSAGEGPKGAANVPLTTTGSIAIDRSFYPFGVPVWIETTLPEKNGQQRPFSALFVTQDTGGAIKGAARADVFWGAGGQAEYYSGHMKQSGNFYILLPKSVAQRLNNLY